MFFERNAQETVETFVPDHTDVKQVHVRVCVCVCVCVCVKFSLQGRRLRYCAQ